MADDVQLLALYLPQFHPVPENDEFWGEGFTEWTSTLAAVPSFSDQRQPRLPGELGTYDLRDPNVVAQQEQLATEYGIDAFVYYHYWFEGRRVMGGPLDAKRANPDHTMPFALCWANHDWNRNQNGLPPELLIEQRYSAEDDTAHTAFLAETFTDARYLRWQGRPVFFMYRTQEHPDPVRFADQLRAASIAAGAGDPYLIRFETNGSDGLPPTNHHFDAGADLHPHWLWHTPEAQRPRQLPVGRQGDFWMDYDAVAAASSARSTPPWRRFPCVAPDWDTSARKQQGGAIALRRSSTIGYETWLSREITQQRAEPDGPRLIVLNAWNEWSECGYLEPDAEYGRALLEATARAKGIAPALADEQPAATEDDLKMYDLVIDPESESTAYRWVLELTPSDGRVLEIGCGAGHLTEHLQRRGNTVTAVDINPTAAARAARFAADAFALDLDRHLLSERLRGQQFDCIVLADVLEHVRSPLRVLTDALALLTPDGAVVISVPNVGHVDSRLMLLQGRWDYQPTGILDDSHLRFFTRTTLTAMLRDAGLEVAQWRRTERAPFATNLGVGRHEVPQPVLDHLLADPDATTYQFILQAHRGSGADAIAGPVPTRHAIDLGTAADPAVAAQLAATTAELEAYRNLKILRLANGPRRVYGRLRRLVRR